MRHCALPVMQSDGHRLPSVYRVLHTLAKTTPRKQRHGTFNICAKSFFQKHNLSQEKLDRALTCRPVSIQHLQVSFTSAPLTELSFLSFTVRTVF